jgi:hypothetical protein
VDVATIKERTPMTKPLPQDVMDETPVETVPEAREEIERTRADLGDVAHVRAVRAAPPERTDLKAQFRRTLDHTKDLIATRTSSVQASIANGEAPAPDPVAAARRTSEGVVDATRRNPPAALVGAFVAGLFLGRLSKRRRPSGGAAGE